ncbi:hypothetical protein [Aquiflexum gelatinilyticum]|uniref:hypothetical protein n=1 Tax=Aquiflexum gelatinilyticum TaxID=2961943 RepID=UPI002168471D|nr:hypothetical protein [Aquiflexum gelatinilyticum]MCS4435186.1 hypothetical protein [Aquiflexum gelatinilyticum]
MTVRNQFTTKGFILSGLMNIFGVLIFSRFFTNSVIPDYDSQAMSNFGLLMIVVWGFAFISVSKNFDKVPWLIGVFVIEKLVYASHWTNWMINNKVSEVFEKDKMAGIFYSIYGINDWVFFFFFLVVFLKLIQTNK